MKYLLQMNGSVAQLRWTYEFQADDDQDAVKTARRMLENDRAAQTANYIVLWDVKGEKVIRQFEFKSPALIERAA